MIAAPLHMFSLDFYGAKLTEELCPLGGIALMRFCETNLHISARKFLISSHCVNVAKHTLKIMRCEHRKIFKGCWAIFQRYA